MKIIIEKNEIRELIANHVQPIIGDKDFTMDFNEDGSANIQIGSLAAAGTVGTTIEQHVGPDVKKEEPKKRTRRNRAEMIADGDAEAANEEEQAAADKIVAERAGTEDATVEEIKEGTNLQTDPEPVEETLVEEAPKVPTTSKVDSLFNN